ncbi:hypothetical protein HZ994_15255 [Akkermansiaceae bacterium]|nr:hypothetical protein HZ994_15255 [Akkermansiaceae bacterium]
MNEDNLTRALNLLGEFLADGRSAPVWLVVGGGSALIAQRLSTRPTKDVDVMALREWEGNVISAYPLPAPVKDAAAKVAVELRLDSDWLNGAASLHGFDLSLLPTSFWQDIDTREYGQTLKVSFIGRPGLILLKLSAALGRDQRRDIEDLLSLSPNRAETEGSLRWILQHLHGTSSHHKLHPLLQELGHADLIPTFT